MRCVVCRLRRVFCVGVLLWVGVAPAFAQNTYLLLNSQAGDWIGGGLTSRVSEADGQFTVMTPFGNEVRLQFNSPTWSSWWDISFAAPGGVPLVPGSYEGASRFQFGGAGPEMSISGDGRGCNSLTGRFDVLEIAFGPSGALERFAANAEQHCEGAAPALFVAIRYRATSRPPFSITVIPDGADGAVVTSRPAGLSCGATCAAVFDDAAPVILEAPVPLATTFRWEGDADCLDGVVSAGASVTCRAVFSSCTFAIDPPTVRVPPTIGSGLLTVSASSASCTWEPVSSAAWVQVQRGTRQGSGVLEFHHDALTGAPRVATISIGRQTATVIQRPLWAPGPPTDLTVTVNDSVAHVAWAIPPLGGEPTSYVIEAGLEPFTTVVSIPTPDASTTLDIPGVPSGVFYLRVRGVNGYGVGLASDDVELVAVNGVSPPGTPQDLRASVTAGQLLVTWQPPPDGGRPAGYRLEAGRSYLDADIAVLDLGDTSAFAYSNIPPGNYFLRVRAANAAGLGEASHEVLLRVGGVPGPPEPPQGLAVSVVGASVHFSWLAPPGPDPALFYILGAGSASGFDDIAEVVVGGATRSISFAGVPPGVYYVRLWGGNLYGVGLPSNEVLVVVAY